jgi:D-threo-aldose 1-dehydrogenase
MISVATALPSRTGGTLPTRALGTTGLHLTSVGVGGWLGLVEDLNENAESQLWGRVSTNQKQREAAACLALRTAYDLGIRYFDTAPMYGRGEAERLLGVALLQLSEAERSEIVVSTKVGWRIGLENRYDGPSVKESLKMSLETLGVQKLDFVLVHDPEKDDHITEICRSGGTFDVLQDLKGSGALRGIGVGVRSHRFLRTLMNTGRVDLIMPSYDFSPIRASAKEVIDEAQSAGIGVINASPYMAGMLSGINPRDAVAKRPLMYSADLDRAERIFDWCQERNLSVGALAIQYSLRHSGVTCALSGPRTASEVQQLVDHLSQPIGEQVWGEFLDYLATLPECPDGGASM